mmetsp:Transcript_4563/g.9214  ORF Transcript_4563/g.9214 Transcript_4563/m.9214 type:complete len:391 (-) Transcript_4563:27-1199(-)|eukprot:CAMPEP_0118645684 /NCGR_PEP_ID=MMETSP0785-20121206/7637_1 /TAXON_ID=91992 /ORGANISM="Bolidomonas pacifica, Strain CCMP 1866" /LENGTH=390 /DNA_ID=CAMNT_0006537593 /DNA_START=96 /DNA_END=1268 /DNA_ORIENTATION=-
MSTVTILLLLLCIILVIDSASSTRPAFSDGNATSWRKPGTCNTKKECPVYFDCYDDKTGVLTEISRGTGHCSCYRAFGKDGDSCEDPLPMHIPIVLLFLINIFGASYVFSKAANVLWRLRKCKALDLKKPGNLTMAFLLPTTGFLSLYKLSLFVAAINADPSGFFAGVLRRISTGFLVLFLQLSSLQIAITWLTIGGSAGKKNVKFTDYPKNIKVAYWICQGLKSLTVIVVITCGALGEIQMLRMYTFLQFVMIAIFYLFGSRILAKMLTPTQNGMSEEKYKAMCEPAMAIKKCGKTSFGLSLLYLLLSASSSGMLASKDKGDTGIMIFELSILSAIILFNGIMEYCRFGVRKTLAKGKDVGGWGLANRTGFTTKMSTATVTPDSSSAEK